MDKSNKKSVTVVITTVILVLAVTTSVSFSFTEPVFATLYEGSFTFPNGSSIVYVIEDGKVTNLILDEDASSLITDVETDSEYGVLVITIPRNILDAKTDSEKDDIFFVLVDGEEIEHTEYQTEYQEFRTLIIPLSTTGQTIEIEIIGTVVFAGLHQPSYAQRGTPLSNTSKLPTQITLDISDRETNAGQLVVFSGILTSNGQPVPHAEIEIRDEDFADLDDLLELGRTDDNGRFSIPWIVRDVDTKDRQTSARLLEFSTQMYVITLANSILNTLDANTVEAFAEFKGTAEYTESKSCKKITSYGVTENSCQNNILVITDTTNTGKKMIASSLLKKIIQTNDPTGQSELLLSILYDDKLSQSSVDNLHDIIIIEFFSLVDTNDYLPQWVDNIVMWYKMGMISEQDLINLIQFLM